MSTFPQVESMEEESDGSKEEEKMRRERRLVTQVDVLSFSFIFIACYSIRYDCIDLIYFYQSEPKGWTD